METIIIDHKKAFNHDFGAYIMVLPTAFVKNMIANKSCNIKSGKNTYPLIWVKFINYPYLEDGETALDVCIGIEAVNAIKGDEEMCICHYFIPAVNSINLVLAYNLLPPVNPWTVKKMTNAIDTSVSFYPNHDYPEWAECDMCITFHYDSQRLTSIEPFDMSRNKSKRYYCHELTALRFAKVSHDGEVRERPVIRLRNEDGHIEYYAHLYTHTDGLWAGSKGHRNYLFAKVPKEDVYSNKATDFFSKPYDLSNRMLSCHYQKY